MSCPHCSIVPNIALEPTAYSFGYAYASGGGSPRALGAFKLRGHENRRHQFERVEISQLHVLCTM